MSELDAVTPPKRGRGRPPKSAILPATDAADSDIPISLSPDAVAGTRDRALAMTWMEQDHQVRRRPDGVYEQLLATVAAPPEVEDYGDFPHVELLERRLLDPHVEMSAPILFRDEVGREPGRAPKWYKRWVNTLHPSRLQQLTNMAGFQKATWDLVADKNEIGDRYDAATDNIVRRGERGREVLVYMPYTYWQQIKTEQAKLRKEKRRVNPVRPEEVAAGLGDQAATFMATRDAHGRPGLIGEARELAPMALDALEGSRLPRDMSDAGAVAAGASFDE